MEKTAQGRNIFRRLREFGNFGGKIREELFPQFRSNMLVLREKDNEVRNIALGKDSKDPRSLKEIFEETEKSFDNQSYVQTASLINDYIEKLDEINAVLSEVKTIGTKDLEEFMKGDLSKMDPSQIEALKEKWEKKSSEEYLIVKQSFEWWDNFKRKHFVLSFLKRNYPKRFKVLDSNTRHVFNRFKNFHQFVLSTFDKMGESRSVRELEDYILAAKNLDGKTKTFKDLFQNYFNINIRDFLQQIPEIQTQTDSKTDSGSGAVGSGVKTDLPKDVKKDDVGKDMGSVPTSVDSQEQLEFPLEWTFDKFKADPSYMIKSNTKAFLSSFKDFFKSKYYIFVDGKNDHSYKFNFEKFEELNNVELNPNAEKAFVDNASNKEKIKDMFSKMQNLFMFTQNTIKQFDAFVKSNNTKIPLELKPDLDKRFEVAQNSINLLISRAAEFLKEINTPEVDDGPPTTRSLEPAITPVAAKNGPVPGDSTFSTLVEPSKSKISSFQEYYKHLIKG